MGVGSSEYDPEAVFQLLKAQWDGLVADLFDQEDHPLFSPGKARGGTQPVGGPLWLDWDEEFTDALPLPQLVGHTVGKAPRQKGRSWCVDCRQTVYVVLQDGVPEMRWR